MYTLELFLMLGGGGGCLEERLQIHQKNDTNPLNHV